MRRAVCGRLGLGPRVLGYLLRMRRTLCRTVIGPLPFWDTLVATDWDRRFESFDDDQLWQLGRYNELAHELGQSSFFSEPLTFSFKASTDDSYQRLDHAGYDSLRSMTMSFRQLWELGEPARLETTRDLLRSHALPARDSVDVVVLLDVLGDRYKAATRQVMMKGVRADDLMGEPKTSFQKEVLGGRRMLGVDDITLTGGG